MPKLRRVPTRSCVACHRVRPKRELIRIVRTPVGEVKVDRTGKVSGRGAYVCAEAACVETGLHDGRLQHALEMPIPGEVGAALRQVVVTSDSRQAMGDGHART